MKRSIVLYVVVLSLAIALEAVSSDDDSQHESERSLMPGQVVERTVETLSWYVGLLLFIHRYHHQKPKHHHHLTEIDYSLELRRPRMAFTKVPFASSNSGIENTQRQDHSVLEPHNGMLLQVVEKGGSLADQVEYQLDELVHDELGVTTKHVPDFAYTPVETMVNTEEDGKEINDYEKEEEKGVGNPYQLDWWSWWLREEDLRFDDTGKYDMNDRAFAGGSHGEIWRGHRNCKIPSESSSCGKKLVFKRLRIEKGYKLLEAGLREVYFGKVLAYIEKNNNSEGSYFTRYVDHFFRQQSGTVELWIVFEDAGSSLRSYLYTGSLVGDHVVYQQSVLWQRMRSSVSVVEMESDDDKCNHASGGTEDCNEALGRRLMRFILTQVLKAAEKLHENGIVVRDIKPSNILCTSIEELVMDGELGNGFDPDSFRCILGDFSSAWDTFVARNLYTRGPSRAEQTDEYAPPEAIFGSYNETILTPAFDSWSIGILALELLLGTPKVFTVDQRTKVVLTHKMRRKGATEGDIQKALYLAALSQFCIFSPSRRRDRPKHVRDDWPLRYDDPPHKSVTMNDHNTCTIADFHMALRARDPLGIGFESSSDSLLHLIWKLLEFYPEDRVSAKEALQHPYITGESEVALKDVHAVESLMLDPRLDFNSTEAVSEFYCPKCGRLFTDWRSCYYHATKRKHAKFCHYDKSTLPRCISTHPLLPAHSNSGYCDIQGRRKVIEDFHTIHLFPTHQFYGIFDGHLGNLASKFVASSLYDALISEGVLAVKTSSNDWRDLYGGSFTRAFGNVHKKFLNAVHRLAYDTMDQSGTTATVMLVAGETMVFANLGDSRAVISWRSNGELKPKQLTKDHVASDPDESKQVIQRGGHISKSGGIDRVNGKLAVTRSIGDAGLIEVLSQEPDVAAFSSEEIMSYCGPDNSTCFVVLASDGLWDVMTNQEVVDMVDWKMNKSLEGSSNAPEHSGEKEYAFQQAAESLVHEAYIRGSTDNIGVCVVGL